MVVGCTIAFIWTFFPYPLTAGTSLRRQLGETLYLLGNYYSVVHYTIRTRLDSSGGDPHDKKSPHALLERVRTKLLGKLLAMDAELQGNLSFIPLEFTFGGKFPMQEYKGLVKSVARYVWKFSAISKANGANLEIVSVIIYHSYHILPEVIFMILTVPMWSGWRIWIR